MNMKKIAGMGLLALLSVLAFSPAKAATLSNDPQVYAGAIHHVNNGKQVFVLQSWDGATEADTLVLYGVDGSTWVVSFSTSGFMGVNQPQPVTNLDLGPNSGLGLGTFSSTDVAARIPRKVGEMIFNTTLGLPCVSTGAAVAQYIVTGATTTQALSLQRLACY